jgi:hypothetical protein
MAGQDYVERTKGFAAVFAGRPTIKQRTGTKRAFWYGSQASELRRASWLLHSTVSAPRATCVRCLVNRIYQACVLSGVALCSTCTGLFHREAELP